MPRTVRVLLGFASIILAAVVWLAFHDIAEAHTVRDWLTLLAAAIVWFATALALLPRAAHAGSTRMSGAAYK